MRKLIKALKEKKKRATSPDGLEELEARVIAARAEAVKVARQAGSLNELAEEMLDRIAKTRSKADDAR